MLVDPSIIDAGQLTTALRVLRKTGMLASSAGRECHDRNRFAYRNSSGVLKALKKRGVPANDSGDTGPMVINEYSRVAMSKEE